MLLHTCGGLAPFVNDWAGWLQGEGYVALVVDSFTPRGTTNVCRDGRNPTMQEVAADAFGALRYLRSLPFVDAERVGVMGWSYGAGATLLASRAGDSGGFPELKTVLGGCMGPRSPKSNNLTLAVDLV